MDLKIKNLMLTEVLRYCLLQKYKFPEMLGKHPLQIVEPMEYSAVEED
jgi:hypothetical protein